MSSPNLALNNLLNNNPWNKTSYVPFSGSQLQELFKRMDSSKELYRAGVVFIDRNLIFTELRANCRADQKSLILIERIRIAGKTVAPPPKDPGSTMSGEQINVAWACSSTAVTWLALVGEGALGFETFGAAWSLMPATTASAIASSAACGIAVGRMFNVSTGNSQYNDWIDKDPIFQGLMLVLDAVQMMDVANTVRTHSPKWIEMFKRNSKQSVITMYKNMSSAARLELAEELMSIKKFRDLEEVQGAIKLVLNGQRQLANSQAAIKTYHQMHLDFLAKSGVLDIIGAAITTGGSARPGQKGTLDKLNRKTIEILVGITE